MDQATGNTHHMQQTMANVEMEKDDLQNQYKEVCAENKRLKETVNTMGLENKEMFARSTHTETDKARMEHTIRELVEKEQGYLNEIKNREDHISHLTQQLNHLAQERNQASEFCQS